MSVTQGAPARRILVLGLGNTLLRDDGLGVHVARRLAARPGVTTGARVVDGGTLGLALLPDVEDADGLIVVDAAELGEAPGTVRVFENAAMDQQLSGRRSSVHELAIADLLAAAALTGRTPSERALVAIQPASTDWGLAPSAGLDAVIDEAAEAVSGILARWGT